MTMFPGGGGRIQKDVIYLDPLFYVVIIFLGAVPIYFLGVLSQSDAVLVGKVTLITGMGTLGFVMIHSLFAVKQTKIKWLPIETLFNRNMFLVVLILIAGTYLSQTLIFAGTNMQLSLTQVISGKLFYGSVGIFEEGFFGILLFLLPNALFDNPYWTAFNMILNPLLFGIYHIFVIGSSLAALSYVIFPRILFNITYLLFALPSVIMLAHFSWNFMISGIVASITAFSIMGYAFSIPQLSALSSSPIVMMLASPALAGPLTLTLNCLPAIGLLAYKAAKSR